MPMSPMHRPIVGTLALRTISRIRTLSCGWLAIVEILTMSGSHCAQAAVDLVEVVGRLAEIVEADDPLGLAEAGNAGGDVVFQVDVFDAFGDRRPQQQLPLLLRARPFAAVGRAAAGDDHRAGPIGEQPLEVDVPVDVVQSQFDQLGPLLDQVPVFGDHVPMPAAADADANHD